jgi:coenzyme F420 hydrogenase subunit beta
MENEPLSRAPESLSPRWADLYEEVVAPGRCTGCGACVIACAYGELRYDDASFLPLQVGALGPDRCARDERTCGVCARACPRFRDTAARTNHALFGRDRTEDEPAGIVREIVFARATDPATRARAQDGGVVSALLAWGLRTGRIDGAVTAGRSTDRPWDAVPAVLASEAQVFAAAGSRYTFAPVLLALDGAVVRGLRSVALVGTSCQASATGAFEVNRLAKWRRRIAWTFGLLCSKTFTYEGLMQGRVHDELGIGWDEITKVNIKGKIIVSRAGGEDAAITLKEARPWTRPGCERCPDFAAEHGDLSFGGIGETDGWTLTIVRTPLGHEILESAVGQGVVERRPADGDGPALALLE